MFYAHQPLIRSACLGLAAATTFVVGACSTSLPQTEDPAAYQMPLTTVQPPAQPQLTTAPTPRRGQAVGQVSPCLLYTSPSPRDS